jgi:Flp pilus assembly protein TadD
MRYFFWLFIAATALAGCSTLNPEGKSTRNAALTGKEEVKLRLAHATEDAGDFASAEKMFQQIAQQVPGAVAPQLELAGFYRRHREDQKAIESLDAAAKLEPGNTDIKRELANTYIGVGEPEKAITLLDQAIAINRKDPLLYNSKGVALDQIGSYSEAQNCYKAAFDRDPVGGTTYKINISMSYILEGAYDKAIALLRPMLSAPEAPPIVRQNLALAYGMKGENEAALKLGLQDLSTSEAEENVRFYCMLAHKHGMGAGAKTGAAAVPASAIQDLFPADEPAVVSPAPPAVVMPPHSEIAVEPDHKIVQAAPVSPVNVSEETAPIPAPPKPVLRILSATTPSSGDKADDAVSAPPATSVPPDESPLPAPVLKPDRY